MKVTCPGLFKATATIPLSLMSIPCTPFLLQLILPGSCLMTEK